MAIEPVTVPSGSKDEIARRPAYRRASGARRRPRDRRWCPWLRGGDLEGRRDQGQAADLEGGRGGQDHRRNHRHARKVRPPLPRQSRHPRLFRPPPPHRRRPPLRGSSSSPPPSTAASIPGSTSSRSRHGRRSRPPILSRAPVPAASKSAPGMSSRRPAASAPRSAGPPSTSANPSTSATRSGSRTATATTALGS